MLPDIIHHYTDISTFASILKNRTIRFNRLDRVDDITEGEAFTQIRLEKFFFVSCWTYDDIESLPQWNMYTTNMSGVRITLPRRMFDYKPLVVPYHLAGTLEQHGVLVSPIPFEKIFGDKFLIPPMFLDEHHFGRIVRYCSDYAAQKNEAIKVNDDGTSIHTQIKDPTGIAALKSPDWEFQKEFRFVLLIFPSFMPKSVDGFIQLLNHIPNIVTESLQQGTGPDLEYFDISLDQSTLDNMKITAGPLCTEGEYTIIEALLAKYAPSVPSEVLTKSKFTGTIRKAKSIK
jgi:hypothetical protein